MKNIKKSFLLSLLILVSINVFAQYSPNGLPQNPVDSIYIGTPVIMYTTWKTRGNEINTIYGSKLGSTNACPIYFITNNETRIAIDTLGNVGIGTSNPQAKLAVDGSILAKSVKVNTSSSYWPDYVFSQDYELMNLKDLENYIYKNQHLPGIISAKEVEMQGNVDIGEINAKLLEKIEELTLYIIDLQEQINKQQKQINELKTK